MRAVPASRYAVFSILVVWAAASIWPRNMDLRLAGHAGENRAYLVALATACSAFRPV